jgi:hypothetical protein
VSVQTGDPCEPHRRETRSGLPRRRYPRRLYSDSAAPASKNSQLSNMTNVIVDMHLSSIWMWARNHMSCSESGRRARWRRLRDPRRGGQQPRTVGSGLAVGVARVTHLSLGAAVVPGRRPGRLQARTASGPAANVSDRIRAYSADLRFRWKHSSLADLLKIGQHRQSRTHAGLQAQAAARMSMPSRGSSHHPRHLDHGDGRRMRRPDGVREAGQLSTPIRRHRPPARHLADLSGGSWEPV